ncbi:MAG: hypothetical protein ABI220_02140 [Candidatus Saccharimonadales bacterium]
MSELAVKNASRWAGTLAAVLVVIAVVLLWGHVFSNKAPEVVAKSPAPGTLSDIQNSETPWSADTDHLSERLRAMGLPELKTIGTALHIHPHVDIYIDGKPVEIPPYVGINMKDNLIAAIHTYDTSGVLHIQPERVRTFTLGQFFDIWGVDFTGKRIGAYQTDSDKTIEVFLNGKLYSGDPRGPVLKQYEEIVVAYGTTQELPSPIPSKYDFPADY